MQRTFELIEGSSRKFWAIELDGKKTIVTFGRIGTKGQRKEKKFKTDAAAQKEYDKLIKEKLGKGYKETTREATPAAGADSGDSDRGAGLREALEAALVENPDDLASHAAYADLLSEEGDPRGELIQIQIALEDETIPPKQRKDLRKRERHLLSTHVRAWFGDLAAKLLDEKFLDDRAGHETSYTFRRGWIEALHLVQVSSPMLRSVCDNPIFSLLRELALLEVDWDKKEEEVDLTPLLRAPFARQLRSFQIGPLEPDCHIGAPDVHKLIPNLPHLEELRLCAHKVKSKTVFALPMPKLRLLVINHICEYPLEVLAKNESLAKLEHLSLWPHALQPGGSGAYITPESFIALIRSPHLVSLRHLRVFNSDLGDEGCAALVTSGILKRLKVLEASYGCITDAGAAILAECPDFKNLERFVVHQNMLTARGVRALRATGVKVEAKEQFRPEEVEEQEYLWEGDME